MASEASRILGARPLLFRVVLVGEVLGMSEKEVEFIVSSEIALSCRLGALMKGMSVQFGAEKIPGIDVPKPS